MYISLRQTLRVSQNSRYPCSKYRESTVLKFSILYLYTRLAVGPLWVSVCQDRPGRMIPEWADLSINLSSTETNTIITYRCINTCIALRITYCLQYNIRKPNNKSYILLDRWFMQNDSITGSSFRSVLQYDMAVFRSGAAS